MIDNRMRTWAECLYLSASVF